MSLKAVTGVENSTCEGIKRHIIMKKFALSTLDNIWLHWMKAAFTCTEEFNILCLTYKVKYFPKQEQGWRNVCVKVGRAQRVWN